MENKIIALFLIAAIGGLFGGFALSYSILEPQIQNLQNVLQNTDSNTAIGLAKLQTQITLLNWTIRDMQNVTWHEVYSLASSSDTVTGMFQLKGSAVRVMWISLGDNPSSWVSFQLHFSNGTAFGVWASSGIYTANNAALELMETDNYYLNITTVSTIYAVSVYDYY